MIDISIEDVRSIHPSFYRLEQTEIFDNTNSVSVGWNFTAVDSNRTALSSGTDSNFDTAKRKAIAELIERGLLKELSSDKRRSQEFMFDQFKTSCGFAVGFESDPTRLRSLFESIERWAFSNWIDRGCEISMSNISVNVLCPLSKRLVQTFEKWNFYFKSFVISDNGRPLLLYFGAFVGIESEGIFVGTKVSTSKDLIIGHSIVEAWRNHRIFNRKNSFSADDDVFLRRIDYFGKNKAHGLEIVNSPKEGTWGTPQVLFNNVSEHFDNSVFLWRHLIKDYMPLELGGFDRFVM